MPIKENAPTRNPTIVRGILVKSPPIAEISRLPVLVKMIPAKRNTQSVINASAMMW